VRALERDVPGFAEYIADRTRVNERRDWGWTLSDHGLGIAALAYPPAVYTVLRYGALSGATPFDGVALLLMLAGGAAYVMHRRSRLRRYRCPRCANATVRLPGELIRLSCAVCGVTWLVGRRIAGDG
jgi:hypothetical protein